MIAGISQDKAEQIISLRRDEYPEDFELTNQWKKFFIVFGIMTALPVALLVARLIMADDRWWRELFIIGGMLILDAYVVYKYMTGRVLVRKRFTKRVAEYGRNELVLQLQAPTAKGFFIEPGEYANLIVLTNDYLIAANEFVYCLKDVSRIVIEKERFEEYKIEKQKYERVRTLMRCAYSMKVSVNGGRTRRELISIREEDIGKFVTALEQRATEAEVKFIAW